MNIKKNKISILLILVLIMFIVNIQPYSAKTWTKADINKKISQLNQQIATLKKEKEELKSQYASVKKQYDEQTKGTEPVYGKVIATNPYIIEANNLISYDYYWIIGNTEYLTRMLNTVTGYVKPTGNYHVYNNITCAEATPVQVTASPSQVKNKIEKIDDKISYKRQQINLYKMAFSAKATIHAKKKYALGQTVNLNKNLSWTHGSTYNRVTWKSSNNNVATINSKGIVTPKKEGKVIITAKTSISNKESKKEIYFYNPIISCECDGMEGKTLTLTVGDKRELEVEFVSDTAKPEVSFTSYDSEVVTVSDKGELEAISKGTTTVQIETDYSSYKIRVKVKRADADNRGDSTDYDSSDSYYDDDYDDDNYYDYDDEYTYTDYPYYDD